MKSKFLKTVLPAFAIMLALVASLAFTASSEDVLPFGWYEDPITLEPTKTPPPSIDCSTTGTVVCTYLGEIVYKTDDLDLIQDNELYFDN